MEPDRFDSLTGLLNRLSFDSALVDAIASHAEDSGIVAVILADLDGLKLVNDKFGHCAGDEALKGVAKLLLDITRDEAVVCRYGGDEFFALCTSTTEPRAQQLAVRIETEVSSLIMNWEGQDIGPISITTGLAYYPQDGRRAVDLTNAADLAMVRKKRGDDEPTDTDGRR